MQLRRLLTLIIGLGLILTGLVVAPQAAHAAPIDTEDRQAVQDAYQQRLKPALAVPFTWTGNAAACQPGQTGAAHHRAALDAVNYYREMAGLGAVVFDAELSRRAQEAALVMAANKSLSHDPPSTWRCWTETARAAAGASNLNLGWSWGTSLAIGAGANAMASYMNDHGDGNTSVGHRRWLLRPQTTTMGSGSATATVDGNHVSANALYVIDPDRDDPSAPNPPWVAFPTAGYFPWQVEPNGRWSLSADTPTADFSAATVTVTGPKGALKVTRHTPEVGYGNATVVFEVGSIPKPPVGEVHDYTVRVTGIRDAASANHSYTVRVFHADPIAITPGAVSITGSAQSGRSLVVDRGTWLPSGVTTTVQWLADGVPIAGATGDTLHLANAQVGKRITAEVTGSHVDGLPVTRATSAVGPVRPYTYERTKPYTLAGEYEHNGRQWRTQCDAYSQTERCRTEIWATVVHRTSAGYERKQGWAFNNLTYLPYMVRASWKTNPLGGFGQAGFNDTFSGTDGSSWRTECDTATTGRNACRSYRLTTVYSATARATGGYSFSQSNQWVFNNIVLFGHPSWR